jgi:4-amino-4-deoxy-L-arabinose transferase-like glycosyltransferase
LCAGAAFVPWLGLENDEALFGTGLYQTAGLTYGRWVFGHRVPVMLMSYLGALKTWLYALVFHFWTPCSYSIRMPMVIAGAANVWLLFALLRRLSSVRAAVLGAVLLATDASFLLTTTFDWGPVALQHLLLTAGVLLLVVFCQESRLSALAAGCFCLGLGLWDKALFSWMLGGLAVAAVTVYPKELIRLFRVRRAGVAVLAFCLGALPLLLFNLNAKHRLETFRSNVSWTADDLRGRARLAGRTLDGSGLFGYLTLDDSLVPSPQPPRTLVQRVSFAVNDAAGRPRASLQLWAFLGAVAVLPWLWKRQGWKGEVRILVFALVFLGVAWIQMALTRNAGGSVHHAVLLWPAPTVVLAVAFGSASGNFRRGLAALAVLGVVLAGANVLVLNNYYAQMAANGGTQIWSEAIFTLSDSMRQVRASNIYVTDWGMFDNLYVLHRGALPLRVADPLSKPSLDAADRETVRGWVSDASNVFIGYTEGNEVFTGCRKNLLDAAASAGFRRDMLRTVSDRHGRPIFEVFRFVR